MDYIIGIVGIEILLLVVFLAFWAFARRDLKLLARQARPPAGDELAKVSANIEQLLDSLDEKSASADRNLRQLIEEAKDAALQIEQATEMAVKSLEAAAAPVHAAVQEMAAAPAPAIQETIVPPVEAQPAPRMQIEPEPQPEPPARSSLPIQETQVSPPPAPTFANDYWAAATGAANGSLAPPAGVANGTSTPPAGVTNGYSAPPAFADPPTPLGLNPVATDAFTPNSTAAASQSEPPGFSDHPGANVQAPSARRESVEPMPAIDDVFTPWPAQAARPDRGDPVSPKSDGFSQSLDDPALPKSDIFSQSLDDPALPKSDSFSQSLDDPALPVEDQTPVRAETPISTPEQVAETPVAPVEERDFRPFAIAPEAVTSAGESVAPLDSPLPVAEPFHAAAATVNGGQNGRRPAAMVDSTETPASQDTVVTAASPPATERFSEVYALAQQGVADVSEIARQTGLGRTEVEMVLSLWRRQ